MSCRRGRCPVPAPGRRPGRDPRPPAGPARDPRQRGPGPDAGVDRLHPPEVFDDVRSGEAIWFDDGKIGGVVERVEPGRVRVRITHARVRGEKLRGDKGINLPDSALRIAAMTEQDRRDLGFIAANADVVELSFANTAKDVGALQEELERLGGHRPAIVLKVETRRGFENLPDMLLTAMRQPSCGVMIARGDLAVECGFERMAEVQEEILWICEAAHIPVIWATQVLESLAKDGMPSRAEITDAAMGHRAECVMLNKGPHVLTAIRVLDNILHRMQAHQTKKRAMLRELRLAHGLRAVTPRPEADVAPREGLSSTVGG
ncbi:MAG: pyruvate kinase [Planctomycetota bacterium]